MSNPDLYLSPNQQDLLMAALTSNQPSGTQRATKRGSLSKNVQRSESLSFTPGSTSDQTAPGSGRLDFSDDSPYLDFGADDDFDDSFNFDEAGQMIGDLPDDPATNGLHDKRKSIDGQDEDDEGGGKRREGDDKTAKKPGRKPLTSEPTNKRKAQNRAAQRAFRERKEKHLKDLETKVEDLEKSSEAANHENGLLKAQVEKLQIELREYRKRLSWITNGVGRANSIGPQQQRSSSTGNDFQFEFPKFGDLPSANFSSSSPTSHNRNNQRRSTDQGISSTSPAPASAARIPVSSGRPPPGPVRKTSVNNTFTASPPQVHHEHSVDSLTGLFSPSILRATRNSSLGYFPEQITSNINKRGSIDNGMGSIGSVPGLTSNSSNTDSPGSSSDSHQHMSSIGTSPETLFNSPGPKQDFNPNSFGESNHIPGTFGKSDLCGCLQQVCGDCNDPVPPILSKSNVALLGAQDFNTEVNDNSGIDWLAQQNGGGFDPVLFGDYRETQENILSQDFGSFFNDAYPLPDLGSPLHNYDDMTAATSQQATKNDLIQKVDAAKEAEEVVPADQGKMLTCNKIWDRLQSMEKFRNGEIDIDNLCSELRSKAKCSEGGAVVDERHVNKILGGNFMDRI